MALGAAGFFRARRSGHSKITLSRAKNKPTVAESNKNIAIAAKMILKRWVKKLFMNSAKKSIYDGSND